MRWPLRNQILIPFVLIIVLAVAAVAISAALLAARHSDRETLKHLQTVLNELDQGSFPWTESVLQRMRGLSGAHFVARGRNGNVLAATLPLEAVEQLPHDRTVQSEIASLADYATVELQATDYYLATITPRTGRRDVSLIVLYPAEIWSKARREAAWPPLVIGVGAIALSVVVAAGLARRFSGRLRSLMEQVAAIANGDFRELPLPVRLDEFRDLVDSVNRTSAELRRMESSLRQTERTRLLAQLAGGLAHQLRNAVTGAKLALQLHQQRCPKGDDQTLTVALRQLALTEVHLRGLLSLGRSNEPSRVSIAVANLTADVVDLILPLAQHTGVDVTHSAQTSSTILGDGEALRAALLNLVQNAIEAAGPGGQVRVLAMNEAEAIYVDVLDNGPGPPEAFRATLFEPFVTSKSEGVGLGLVFARQVAEDHGGTLDWQRVGTETRFRLSLPATSQQN